MCVHQFYTTKPKSSGFGYKILENRGNYLLGPIKDFEYNLNKWYKNPRKTNNKDCGFHIYKNLEEVTRVFDLHFEGFDTHIYRVEYKEAKHHGCGDGGWSNSEVVVAQKIKILRKVK